MSDKFKKLADRLTLLAIFLLPWQTRYIIEAGQLNKGPYEYTTISLYALDLVILLALLFASLSVFSNKTVGNKIHHRAYWLTVVGLLFFTCFSIFVANDRLITLFAWGRLALGVGLAWLIFSSRLSFNKILTYLLIAISLQGLLGAWQFIGQSAPGNKWLGMASHQSYDLGASVVELNFADKQPERWLRAYGSLDHPNMLGGLAGLGLLMAVYLFINLYAQGYSRTKEILLSLAIFLNTIALFVSFSRAGILATAIGLIWLFFLNLKNWRRLFLSFFISGLTVFILVVPYGQLYQSRLAALGETTISTRLETKSLAERADYTRHALQLTKNHPLFGVGAGNYGLAVEREVVKDQLSYYYQPVHNAFLLIFAEIGIFGLICWLLLLTKLLFDCFTKIKTNQEASLAIAGLGLIVVIMFFDHWLWSLHFGIIFFWLIIGLIVKVLSKQTETA